MTQQLSFDLKFAKFLGWRDFYTSTANIEAINWMLGFDRLHTPMLLIYGPEGCGKSHIGRLWAQANTAHSLGLKDFAKRPGDVFDSSERFIIDGSKILLANEDWSFHFINLVINSSKKLLLFDRDPILVWKVGLRDLRSRLLIAPCIRIKDPDEDLMLQIAKKLLKEKGVFIPDGKILNYLKLIERTYAGISAFVKAVETSKLRGQRSIKGLIS